MPNTILTHFVKILRMEGPCSLNIFDSVTDAIKSLPLVPKITIALTRAMGSSGQGSHGKFQSLPSPALPLPHHHFRYTKLSLTLFRRGFYPTSPHITGMLAKLQDIIPSFAINQAPKDVGREWPSKQIVIILKQWHMCGGVKIHTRLHHQAQG